MYVAVELNSFYYEMVFL